MPHKDLYKGIVDGYQKKADIWPWVGGGAIGAGGTLALQQLLKLLTGKKKKKEEEIPAPETMPMEIPPELLYYLGLR